MTALFYTGMRPSELFKLRAEAVSIKRASFNEIADYIEETL